MVKTTTLPADRRFRESFGSYVSVGLCLSVGLHLLVFLALPGLAVDGHAGTTDEPVRLELPPELHVPQPPEEVARPAEPVLSDVETPHEATIEPTVWDRDTPPGAPAPPRVGDTQGDRPPFVPREVEPRLKNREELQRVLRRYYPPALRNAGIAATVVLWIFVDEDGSVTGVRVSETSGNDAVDEAARKVARRMEFVPAVNRDRNVGVWVRQAIRFRVP